MGGLPATTTSLWDRGGGCWILPASSPASITAGSRSWHVPTTLLAMVDATLGGKTGVNLPGNKTKSARSTFRCYPLLTRIPDHFNCRPLPQRGLIEASRWPFWPARASLEAVIANIQGAYWRQRCAERVHSARIAHQSCICQPDVRDTSKRRHLNLGTRTRSCDGSNLRRRITHGDAVGSGMLVAA